MRKTLILLLLIWAIPSEAQLTTYPFPQPGSEQVEIYHGDWTTGGFPFNRSFKYINDTVVSGNVFAKFFRQPYNNPFYTYYNNGKVYFHPTSSSLTSPVSGGLLYDFSMIVGDTISLTSFTHYGNYSVDSVSGMLLLNGQTRKFLRLVKGTDTVKWVDGIGDIEHGLFYEGDFEGGYEEFVCHKDSTGNVHLKPSTNYMCDFNNPAPSSGTGTCGIFSYSYSVIGQSCTGACNGYISITGLTGGTPSYSFSWNNGQSGNPVYGMCGGTYTVEINDASGNSCYSSFYVPTSPTITVSLTSSNISCNGICDGTFQIMSWGGSPPYVYSYSIDGGPFSPTSSSSTNFACAGNYTVCAMDGNGCQACTTTTLSEPLPLQATTNVSSASCSTCCDGNIQIIPNGGVGVYTYSLTPPASSNNFCPGNYYYCVTDANGCSFCDSATVSFPLNIQNEMNEYGFSVYPNPALNSIVIRNQIPAKVSAIEIINILGEKVMLLNIHDPEQTIDISSLKKGIYFLREKDSGTCFTKLIKS
jgi:hypothetical protein